MHGGGTCRVDNITHVVLSPKFQTLSNWGRTQKKILRILQMGKNVRVFVEDNNTFQPSLMFESKTEAYPSGVPFSCFILG
jgi:hypothetical protein